MPSKTSEILAQLKPSRIIIPILIGLGVASYMLYSAITEEKFEQVVSGMGEYVWQDVNNNEVKEKQEFVKSTEGQGNYIRITYREALKTIDWTWYSTLWLIVAVLSMFVRDLSYMYRIRVLTEEKISWRKSFDVIMLWEFASAVSPSAVGGSAVAMFIVNREGISMGRSTAIVLVTSLLDELFFVVMVPIVFLTVGIDNLFPDFSNVGLKNFAATGINLFFTSYFLILLYSVIISWAIFIRPRGFKWLLIKICSFPFLRKWRYSAVETGNEIIAASIELKDKPASFWLKATAATFFSWTGRYWVTNFIIMAFFPVSDHLLIYARQLIMWVIMLISPTPGGSGLAEFAFSGFIGEFIKTAGLIGSIALVWRLISYYPYLFIGAIILPRWLKRVYKKEKGATILQ